MNNFSDRFKSYLNGKITSTNATTDSTLEDDTTKSEVSTSIMDWTSINSDTIKQTLSLNSVNETNVDELMRGLYIDPDILEHKCYLSMRGESLETDSRDSMSTSQKLREEQIQSYLVVKTSNSVVQNLPEVYYTPEYDPIESILIDVSSWSPDHMTENFMKKIEETDTDKDFVMNKLSELIQANYTELTNCIKDVSLISTDVMKAEIQITSSRRLLSQGITKLEKGPLYMNKLHKKKDKYKLIGDILRSLKNVKDIYHSMLQHIMIGEYRLAGDSGMNLLIYLNDSIYSQFYSLKAITVSIPRQLRLLKEKTDQALYQFCHSFSSSSSSSSSSIISIRDYENILYAYHYLDYIHDILGVNIMDYTQSYPLHIKKVIPSNISTNSFNQHMEITLATNDMNETFHNTTNTTAAIISNNPFDDSDSTVPQTSNLSTYINGKTTNNSNSTNTTNTSHVPLSTANCLSGLPEKLLQHLYHHIDECLNYVILRIISIDKNNRVSIISPEISTTTTTTTNAATTTTNTDTRERKDSYALMDHMTKAGLDTLCTELSTESIIPCIIQSCESLTAIIHKYYLLIKWHENPYHPDNYKVEFLHTPSALRQPTCTSSTSDVPVGSDSLPPNSSTLPTTDIKASGDYSHIHMNDVFHLQNTLFQHHIYVYNILSINIYENRSLIWHRIEETLMRLINNFQFSNSIALDDYLGMLWAINAFVMIGYEFCQSKSLLLIDCLRTKTYQYFHRLHYDSYYMLRQMIENESWLHIPLDLHQLHGIVGIIQRNIVTKYDPYSMIHRLKGIQQQLYMNYTHLLDEEKEDHYYDIILSSCIPSINSTTITGTTTTSTTTTTEEANNDVKDSNSTTTTTTTEEANNDVKDSNSTTTTSTKSFLSQYYKYGNPFEIIPMDPMKVSSPTSPSSPADRDIQTDNIDIHAYGIHQPFLSLLLEDTDDVISLTRGLPSNRSIFSSSNHAGRQHSIHESPLAMVVTQTTMNSLVRYTGKYLQMIQLCASSTGSSSIELFYGLCHLFDYYLCAVFVMFVPSEEKTKFLSTTKISKLNAPPVDQLKDFEALHGFLEKSMNRIIYNDIDDVIDIPITDLCQEEFTPKNTSPIEKHGGGGTISSSNSNEHLTQHDMMTKLLNAPDSDDDDDDVAQHSGEIEPDDNQVDHDSEDNNSYRYHHHHGENGDDEEDEDVSKSEYGTTSDIEEDDNTTTQIQDNTNVNTIENHRISQQHVEDMLNEIEEENGSVLTSTLMTNEIPPTSGSSGVQTEIIDTNLPSSEKQVNTNDATQATTPTTTTTTTTTTTISNHNHDSSISNTHANTHAVETIHSDISPVTLPTTDVTSSTVTYESISPTSTDDSTSTITRPKSKEFLVPISEEITVTPSRTKSVFSSASKMSSSLSSMGKKALSSTMSLSTNMHLSTPSISFSTSLPTHIPGLSSSGSKAPTTSTTAINGTTDNNSNNSSTHDQTETPTTTAVAEIQGTTGIPTTTSVEDTTISVSKSTNSTSATSSSYTSDRIYNQTMSAMAAMMGGGSSSSTTATTDSSKPVISTLNNDGSSNYTTTTSDNETRNDNCNRSSNHSPTKDIQPSCSATGSSSSMPPTTTTTTTTTTNTTSSSSAFSSASASITASLTSATASSIMAGLKPPNINLSSLSQMPTFTAPKLPSIPTSFMSYDAYDHHHHHHSSHNIQKVSTILKTSETIHRSHFDSNTLYGLHERIVAAESCWFASKILTETRNKLLTLLPESVHVQVCQYIDDYQLVASQLRGLVYRSMCPIIIKSNIILLQITESSCAWDAKKIRTDPHEWVNNLTNHCKEVWTYINKDDDFSTASTIVREQVWLEVCQAAYDVVLEGFSRIRKCSVEGRANMSMDVQTLHYNLDSIHSCKPPRGKYHVDAFIRASYMNEDAMMAWIEDNWQIYAYRQMVGLLNMTLSSMLNNKKLREAMAVLDKIYGVEEDQNTFSSMLSSSLPVIDESNFKNMISLPKGLRMNSTTNSSSSVSGTTTASTAASTSITAGNTTATTTTIK